MYSIEENEIDFPPFFNISENLLLYNIYDNCNLEENNQIERAFNYPNLEIKEFNSVILERTTNKNELYPINSIIDMLRKNISDPYIREKLDQNNNIEFLNQYRLICNKKKIKIKENIKTNFTSVDLKYKKRGKKRYSKNKEKKTIHDKWSSDNILRKIKGKLFNEYILIFLNRIFGLQDKNASEKLVKLEYKKNVTTVVKKKELDFLNMTLEILFSDIKLSPEGKK